jgi:hypothetical protein
MPYILLRGRGCHIVVLNNARHKASRHFKNKRREYLKDKINAPATNSKERNFRDMYRGLNQFKRGYQPRSTTEELLDRKVAAPV